MSETSCDAELLLHAVCVCPCLGPWQMDVGCILSCLCGCFRRGYGVPSPLLAAACQTAAGQHEWEGNGLPWLPLMHCARSGFGLEETGSRTHFHSHLLLVCA